MDNCTKSSNVLKTRSLALTKEKKLDALIDENINTSEGIGFKQLSILENPIEKSLHSKTFN
jgi:hypothetical protein